MMKGIFHIHTKYSFDANISPKVMVEHIRALGFDFAAITDHETIRGALEAKNTTDFPIIVGAEYYTDRGDIIGLFLEKEVISRNSDEVVKEIKAQGGIVVLPHPYRSHKLSHKLVSSVDVIESFNARSNDEENSKALQLAKDYNKPMVAGADAHFLQELILTEVTIFGKDLKKSLGLVASSLSPEGFRDYPAFICGIKSSILKGDMKITKQIRSTTTCRVTTGLVRLAKQKDPKIIIGWARKLF